VLTVATSGAQAALTPAADKGLGMLFLSGLIIPAILLGGTGRNTPGRRKLLAVCLVFLVLGGCLLQVACGSSGSGNPSTPGNSGTPAGVYTVTITGNASGTSQQTTSVSLTVQ
jgi:hypothetical protein